MNWILPRSRHHHTHPLVASLLLAIGLGAAALAAAQTTQPQTALGVVFDDANANSVRDAGEAGLPGICVSNGRDVVKTDAEGRYRLLSSDDTILFVIKPGGWMTPVSADQLPRFYYIHKPAGSPPSKSPYPGVAPTGPLPASVDFPLHKHAEPDRFDVIAFGDTQVDSAGDIAALAHDTLEGLIGTTAAFGVTLGDIANNKPSLHEPLAQTIARVGIPWYNVIGNHDRNYGSGEQNYFDESFERVFGPSHYAFEYGNVRFIVLNDIQEAGEEKYVAGLGDDQLAFVQSYVRELPQDALLVLMCHIPIGELPEPERRRLFDVLQPRLHNLVLAGHYHHMEHVFLGPEQGWKAESPLHELINVTACGCWWHGAPDELGIPVAIMADGVPKGYSIVTFDQNHYSIRFQASRRPADYQMNIFTPDEIDPSDAAQREVLVNVFAGSSRSKVEMRIDHGDTWERLEPVKRPDPHFARLKELEKGPQKPLGRALPKPMDCPHLWRGSLPNALAPGAHVIGVRVTDMFGQLYASERIVIIREKSKPDGT